MYIIIVTFHLFLINDFMFYIYIQFYIINSLFIFIFHICIYVSSSKHKYIEEFNLIFK